MSVLAGCLRRNVWIDRGYYKLYPNLYTILVAPTGKCRKSTAAEIGVNILRSVDGVRVLHEKLTPEGLISFMQKGNLINPNGQPQPSRDQKSEKNEKDKDVKEKLNMSFRREDNAFIFASELAVFLGTSAYTQGLIELLTSMYTGKDDWDYTTKMHGKVTLYNVNLNILGASNPIWLAKGLAEDSFGGGFMGRTLFVYQEEGSKNAWPTPSDAQKSLELALRADLAEISRLRGQFKITKEAYIDFENWYNSFDPDYSSRLSGYYERKQDHLLKIAMLLAIARGNTLTIEKNDIHAALSMLDDLETFMPKAFAFVGTTNEARIGEYILELIAGMGGAIDHRVLIKHMKHMIKNTRELKDIIDTLEQAGALSTIYNPKTSKTIYFIKQLLSDKHIKDINEIINERDREQINKEENKSEDENEIQENN